MSRSTCATVRPETTMFPMASLETKPRVLISEYMSSNAPAPDWVMALA